jgi:hypothetical protein
MPVWLITGFLLPAFQLHFVRDVNACRYVNHAREGMNEEGQFLPKHVDQLFKKKATLQVSVGIFL